MRISIAILCVVLGANGALARSSGRPSSGSAPRRSSGGRGNSGRAVGGRSSSSSTSGASSRKRRNDPGDEFFDDNDDQDNILEFDIDDDKYDEDPLDEYDNFDDEDEFDTPRRPAVPASRGGRSSVGPGGARGGRGGPPPRSSRRSPPPRIEDDYDDDYDQDEFAPPRRTPPHQSRSSSGRRSSSAIPPSRSRGPPSHRGGREHRMVSYNNNHRGRRGPPPPPVPSAFTRGLSALRDKIPDPTIVKDTMVSAAAATKEKTSQLSSNLYREVKGLTSSELEQVMLKATRPDETPVKTKHVERLVGVTYQISGKYDIYDAVLRKLWNKMAEKDMRTKMKSVYVLHRFAVDGGPDHQEALKQRLRALRKTKDPKRKGSRYFDSKVLMGTDTAPETQDARNFLSRYAHYVLTRAQTFGGIFNEISLPSSSSTPPPPTKKSRSKSGSSRGGSRASAAVAAGKPKTPPLCEEHLKFAQMVLKAGLACSLHDGEETESTAMCVERVAADLMGLTAAVAIALKRELKSSVCETDPALMKQWCEFYSEQLLPDTKKFVKRTSSKLDVYGLYLPSRMSASLPQELLEKGLKLGEEEEGEDNAEEGGEDAQEEKEEVKSDEKSEVGTGGESSTEGKIDTDMDEGDVSMAMSSSKSNGAASSQAEEDEYDEYEYDEYDEYDEE